MAQVGDLIERRGVVSRVTRVQRTPEGEVTWVVSVIVGTDYEDYVEKEGMASVRFVSTLPPDDCGEYRLRDRRAKLLTMARRLRDLAIQKTNVLAAGAFEELETYLYRNSTRVSERDIWFWQTVTLSLDAPNQIAYSPSIEWADNNTRRRHCSLSKFLTGAAKRHGLELSAEAIAAVSNLWGYHTPKSYDYRFEVVSGSDIVSAYRDSPEEWGSCMSGDRSRLVQFYADNPERVRLVKIMQGEEFAGRALLWTCDSGRVVLDRCYPTDAGSHYRALCACAVELGWAYREEGDLDEESVTMHSSSNGFYPYMDTFFYADKRPSISSSFVLSRRASAYYMRETNGMVQGDNGTHAADADDEDEDTIDCAACGDIINAEDAHCVDGESYCFGCYDERYIYLEYRLPGGNLWIADEYSREECSVCEECSEWHRNEDTESTVRGSRVCVFCIEKSYICCEDCREYAELDETTCVGEEWYCDGCAESISDVCSVCDERVFNDDLRTTAEGLCCDSCLVECPECRERKHPEEGCCFGLSVVPAGQLAFADLGLTLV